MHTRRRRTLHTIAILGVVAVATGCSTNGEAALDPSAVSVVASAGVPEQAVVDLYLTENPDASAQVRTAPGAAYAQVVATQIVGGTAADIVRAYPGDGQALAVRRASQNDFFASLDDLEFTSRLNDAQREVLSSPSGEVMAVPVTVSAIGGIYNQSTLDELGLEVPETWSEMLSFCTQAAENGKVAYGLGLKDQWTSQFISYALGATLLPQDIAEVQNDSEAPFSDTEWRTVIEKYVEMKDAKCFTERPNGTSAANVATQMAKGETLATVALTTMIGSIAAETATGTELTFAAIPATDDAKQTRLSSGIGVVFALNAKSKHPERAKDLLEFMATPEAQRAYAKEAGMAPALDDGEGPAVDQSSQLIRDFTAEDRTSVWPDQLWPNSRIQQAHFAQIQSLFAGHADVDAVLRALDEAYHE